MQRLPRVGQAGTRCSAGTAAKNSARAWDP